MAMMREFFEFFVFIFLFIHMAALCVSKPSGVEDIYGVAAVSKCVLKIIATF